MRDSANAKLVTAIKPIVRKNAADETRRWLGRSNVDREMFRLISIRVIKRPFQSAGSVSLVGITCKGMHITIMNVVRRIPCLCKYVYLILAR